MKRLLKFLPFLLKNSFWVVDSDNIPYLVDALARDDTEYLEQLIIERKVFQVDHDTKVMRFGVSADKHFALIQNYLINIDKFTR